jgi:hypothetical protein
MRRKLSIVVLVLTIVTALPVIANLSSPGKDASGCSLMVIQESSTSSGSCINRTCDFAEAVDGNDGYTSCYYYCNGWSYCIIA